MLFRSLLFGYNPALAITIDSVSTNLIIPGETKITIQGSGFENTRNYWSRVLFGYSQVYSSGYLYWSDKKIEVKHLEVWFMIYRRFVTYLGRFSLTTFRKTRRYPAKR